MKKISILFFGMLVCICILNATHLRGFAQTSIIGNDDRIPVVNISQEPYSSIVNIVSEFSYGTTSGTGFFISEYVVATAAHCVYDAEKKEYAKSVSIYVPTRNNAWGGPYKIDKVQVNPTYISWIINGQNYSGNLYDDYAALILNAPLHKEMYPNYWTSFKLYKQNTLNNGLELNLTGVLPRNNGRTMYTGAGNLLNSNEFVTLYNMDSEGGMSGAPVYKKSIHGTGIWNYNVYAIHNAVYTRNVENGGIRITNDVYKWYTDIIGKKDLPTIINGGYTISPLSASDKVLTVPNRESSEHVYQYTYANSSNWGDYQYWTIAYVGNGQYKIINNHSGKALQVARGDSTKGTPIIQFPYTGEKEQHWRISIVKQLSDSYFKKYECVFTNVKTGQVLDITNSSQNNYEEAIQFPYHGEKNQRFILNRKWD